MSSHCVSGGTEHFMILLKAKYQLLLLWELLDLYDKIPGNKLLGTVLLGGRQAGTRAPTPCRCCVSFPSVS